MLKGFITSFFRRLTPAGSGSPMHVLMIAVLLCSAVHVNADIKRWFMYPEVITGVDEHLYIQTWEPIYNKPHLIVRHAGLNQKDIVPTWDVPLVTGFRPIGSAQKTTRAGMDGSLAQGPNAYQMEGTSFGVMMNSWSFPYVAGVRGGPHAVWSYLWKKKDGSAPRPWAYGDGGDLTVQANIKMPHAAFWKQAVAQLSFVVYGQDISDVNNPKLLAYVINIYDNREGSIVDVVYNDGRPFVSTSIESSGVSTKSIWSAGHTNRPFRDWTFFRTHITRDNLLSAIRLLNADNSPNAVTLSTNPAHYQITSVHLLLEGFNDPDQFGKGAHFSVGMAARDIMVLSCDNGTC